MNRRNRSALFWGTLLILLGIGWLLRNFGYLDQGIFRLWPLLLVGGGIWMLGRSFTVRQGGGLVAAIILLTLGVFWLLENFGKVMEDLLLPVLLIAIGLGLLLRNLVFSRRAT